MSAINDFNLKKVNTTVAENEKPTVGIIVSLSVLLISSIDNHDVFENSSCK